MRGICRLPECQGLKASASLLSLHFHLKKDSNSLHIEKSFKNSKFKWKFQKISKMLPKRRETKFKASKLLLKCEKPIIPKKLKFPASPNCTKETRC